LVLQAINQWVDQLDAGLTGKKKCAAIRKKKKLTLDVGDWEFLEHLSTILVVCSCVFNLLAHS
jgi:hypothetical protein